MSESLAIQEAAREAMRERHGEAALGERILGLRGLGAGDLAPA